MNIVVTGGTGLIGSHLVPELLARGHEVTELRRYTATRGLHYSNNHHIVWFDLHDGSPTGELPTPDIIIHLGAMASNAIANQNPLECFDINATGTMRLLHNFRHAPNAVVIAASSSEVYAQPSQVYALNPYAASKIALEEIVRSSGHPFVIMRPFNTYGRAPVGSPVAVADKWCRAALTGDTIWLGDMETIRDYVWRDDHVSAYLSVIQAVEKGSDGFYGQSFDWGTGGGVSLDSLLEVIQRQSADRYGIRLNLKEGYSRANDVPILIGDPSMAEVMFGWKAETDLEKGITKALREWNERLRVG